MTEHDPKERHDHGLVKREWRPHLVTASIAIVFVIALFMVLNYIVVTASDDGKISIIVQIWNLIKKLFGG